MTPLSTAQRAASSPVLSSGSWQFPTRKVEGMEMGNDPSLLFSFEAEAPHTKQNSQWGRENIYVMSAGQE